MLRCFGVGWWCVMVFGCFWLVWMVFAMFWCVATISTVKSAALNLRGCVSAASARTGFVCAMATEDGEGLSIEPMCDGDFAMRPSSVAPTKRRKLNWPRRAIKSSAQRAGVPPPPKPLRRGPETLDEVLDWASDSIRHISNEDRPTNTN